MRADEPVNGRYSGKSNRMTRVEGSAILTRVTTEVILAP